MRGAGADVPVGVTEFGPDGGMEGDALMVARSVRKTRSSEGRKTTSRRLQVDLSSAFKFAADHHISKMRMTDSSPGNTCCVLF